MGRLKATVVRGLLVIGLAVAGIRSAAARVKGVELNGFFGIYGPTNKEGLQGTREALRRGSAAFGGRLTYWTGKALGLELTGAFSPARIRVSSTAGQFARSTAVAMGSGKLMFNLTPGSKLCGLAPGGGVAGIHTGKTVADPNVSATDVAGVAGVSLRINLGENVALRGDFEDYIYNGSFGRGAKSTQDLVVTAGLALKF
ncbi:MAG: hypothetical protein EXR94_10965 [Gemmatimonadetes bacterium]|nr:hypothetical protein [Gemmatimonadota bacterium]